MINEMLKYQDADGKLRALEVELSSNEDRKKAVQAKKFLETAQESVDKIEKRSGDLINILTKHKDSQVRLTEELKEYEVALDNSKDENELTYLSGKASQLINNITLLEKEITFLNDEMKQILSSYSDLKKNTIFFKKQYQESVPKYNEFKSLNMVSQENVKNELQVLASACDKNLFEKYSRIRNDKIYPVLFPLQGSRCGNCRMELSMNALSKLITERVIECEECKRLIYTTN